MRSIAGVLVPDTPLVTRAIEYARVHSEGYKRPSAVDLLMNSPFRE